jgi:hypothetical protein
MEAAKIQRFIFTLLYGSVSGGLLPLDWKPDDPFPSTAVHP